MKIRHQSPALKDSFLAQVSQKKAQNRQATQEALGGSFLGAIGAAMFKFKHYLQHSWRSYIYGI
jgi:hypothetical protein